MNRPPMSARTVVQIDRAFSEVLSIPIRISIRFTVVCRSWTVDNAYY